MFERFKTRSSELERLDTGDFTPAEYEKWQREMWWIHRFFGEVRAIRRTLISDLRNKAVKIKSLLDVGAGNGSLLRAVMTDDCLSGARTVGVELSHLAARAMKAAGITAVTADALSLPFEDAEFDVSMCSLTIHHLPPDAAVDLLREMSRVSRRVYVIDLNREALPYYLYRLFSPLVLQRFTVEDGALSILRAYRPDELNEMARRAGLIDVTVRSSKMNRLVLSGRSPFV